MSAISAPAPATPEQNERLIHRLYEECINHGRLELLEELLAPDFLGGRGERGPAGFRQTLLALRAGFPDIRFELEDVFATGERVAARWRMRATHLGTFAGVAASGQAVTQNGNVIYACAGGRLAQAWLVADRVALLYQIGALQALPPGIEAGLREQLRAAA